MAATTEPLLIKRYASRRLYNTETSDYVTLDDIARFIRDGREVKIVDLKSGVDLTRQYLLQIIAEHESRGDSVLPIEVLTDLVRSYATNAKSVVPQFLAASFEMLREGQSKLMENMAAMPNPMASMPGFEALQRQQRMFLTAMMGGWRPGNSGPEPSDDELSDDAPSDAKPSDTRPSGDKPTPKGLSDALSGDNEDIAEIRRQLAELRKRISRL